MMDATEKMPVLFVGHGSPMIALEENEFVTGFKTIAQEIPIPKAILCISAHWETKGTCVTAMPKPKTIHDFGGFPRELFAVQYPAPGDPELAHELVRTTTQSVVSLDDQWGLDHGCWTVMKHLYPEADIPVVQWSLDYKRTPQLHYDLAKELAIYREKGILIVGSGNIVHNLKMVAWDRLDEDEYAYEWAYEANEKMNQSILNGNHQSLIDYNKQGQSFDLAIPTPEHYIPLLYALALKEKDEPITLFNDKIVGGSLSMTSLLIG